jgi:hypothetical protein
MLIDLNDLRPNTWSITRESCCACYFGQLNTPRDLKAACMIDAPQLLSTPPSFPSNWILMLFTNRCLPHSYRFSSATPSLSAQCVPRRWCFYVRTDMVTSVPSIWYVSYSLFLSAYFHSFFLLLFFLLYYLSLFVFISFVVYFIPLLSFLSFPFYTFFNNSSLLSVSPYISFPLSFSLFHDSFIFRHLNTHDWIIQSFRGRSES